MDLLLVFRLIRIVHFFNLPPCFYLAGYGMSMTVTSTLGIVRHYFERSEEHTSELQSPVPISYAVFCLKKKKNEHT